MRAHCVWVGALLLATLLPRATAQALPEPPTISAAALPGLLEQLKRGDHILYFRHLDTRQDQVDQQPTDLNDCKTQRNLSDAGRARGLTIGRAIKSSGLPIGRVVSSPMCRTLETARLLAGRTESDPELFFAIGLSEAENRQKGQALRKLLTTVPRTGTNTLIIGHTANLQEAVGLWPKPEGVVYVFRPDGAGGVQAVARIAPETWADWLR